MTAHPSSSLFKPLDAAAATVEI
ncbi:(2Fe-2S)-binding protein, partial [Burkholderia multivorans]